MMRTYKFFGRNVRIKAQTATELAVFGAVLLFVMSVMIRSALNTNYNQNQALKAMRLALSKSFASSVSNPDGTGTGDTARNNASILFIEDRTTVDASKYGSLTRTPYIISASGTFTRTLFKPIDYGEAFNLPLFDMYINGKFFVFTTGDFREYNVAGDPGGAYPSWDPTCGGASGGGCRLFYTTIPRINTNPNTAASDYCVADPCTSPNSLLTADQRFDLNRNGQIDGDEPRTANERGTFSWQWGAVRANTIDINLQSGKNVLVDVDGDFKEEELLEFIDIVGRRYTPYKGHDNVKAAIKTVRVLDSQAGDLDFSHNANDPGPKPGLMDAMNMYTVTGNGTYLMIREGKLYNPEGGVFVRSVQKRDQVDIIERQIQLSNDTGRMCNPQINPAVEVCVASVAECFTPANIFKTCFDHASHILYVRSTIQDVRGRYWTTDATPTTQPQ